MVDESRKQRRTAGVRLDDKTRRVLEYMAHLQGLSLSELLRTRVIPEWLTAQRTDGSRHDLWRRLAEAERARTQVKGRFPAPTAERDPAAELLRELAPEEADDLDSLPDGSSA